MGKTLSRMRGHFYTRPKQRFNIEYRSDRVLDKEKPTLSPKYTADVQFREEMVKAQPEIKDAVLKKDEALYDRLKQVYLVSTDPAGFDPDINRKVPAKPDKPLPTKHVIASGNVGFSAASKMIGKTPKGKLDLDNLQSLLSNYRPDMTTNQTKGLADKYGLSAEDTLDLITYCRVFQFHAKPKLLEEEVDKDDPYSAKDSWEDSNIKQEAIGTNISTTKTLPEGGKV